MKTFTISAIKSILKWLAVMLLYLGAWQLIAAVISNDLIFPGPWQTVERIISIISEGQSWLIIGKTLLRVFIGFALGCVIGALLGFAAANSRFAAWLLAPIRAIIKSTPITSFILILLVMLKSNEVPVIIAAIMVTPIMWAGVETGFGQLDAGLKEVGRIYLSPIRRFAFITVPQLVPNAISSAATAWGFAWKSAIAAEILALPLHSIGEELYFSKIYLETVDLFSWTVVVVLLSIITEQLLKAAAGRRRA